MKKAKKKLVLVLFTFLYFMAYAQISPGDLAQAHAYLEGIRNCTQCHLLGEKVTNEKCLSCHTEIKSRIDQKKGFHASVQVAGKSCAACHNDHHGKNFEIIRFKTDTFNHALTGFKLLGKHTEIKCENCHKKELIKDEKLKLSKKTFLGLGNECLSCHVDFHQGSLSKNCVDCHNHQAFKPVLNFDHNKTKFVLNGKHKTADCGKCHIKEIRNGVNYQKFTGLKFDNCTACHKDIHENKFGQNCISCHSENSFKEIKQIATFNHNLTSYPLLGKHAKVDCKVCHKKNYTDALPFKMCTDCHLDYHKNELDKNNQDPNCADCHSVNGFKPSTFPIEKHNQSAFVLNGAHLATPCFSCHLKTETWHFKAIGKVCVDCHQDIHKGLIAEKFYPKQDCKSCHSENEWKNIQFNHKLTDFELKGAHLKQNCRSCHFPKTETGLVIQKFSTLEGNCTECHNDVHKQQFEINGKSDCVRCHSFENWTIQNFDHSKTLFPLDGAHAKVKCKDCHKEEIRESKKYVIYKIKEFKCVNCHS